MHTTARLALVFSFLHPWLSVRADWTYFRGPSQSGASLEQIGLMAGEFPLLWKASVGKGASSVVVAGDRAVTMGNVDGKDTILCLNATSGAELWKYQYPLAVDARMFEGGTLATPTIDQNRVYTISHQGDLFCLDLETGKPLWYKHFQADFGGLRPDCGYAASPLIEGSLLLLEPGGHGSSTVALEKVTGKPVWQSGDDPVGYASSLVADLAAKRTMVCFKGNALVGLDVRDGSELWRQKWKTDANTNAAAPLAIGQRVLISSGYERGAALYDVTDRGLAIKWQNKNLRAHITAPVFCDGAIYGIDGQATPRGQLVCLDAETGAKNWAEKIGGGSLILAGDKLVVLSELGELLIVDANPKAFHASIRQQILGTRCWTPPTLANGRLFCRNIKGDLVVLSVNAPAK